MLDVIIIGSGPAGLSAAVYAKRAMLKTLLIERNQISGGQIIDTTDVDNYLGLKGISGFELAVKFREHVNELDTDIINMDVVSIRHLDEYNEVELSDGRIINARTIVVATGARYRTLNVPGEDKFRGKGVSFCATCDGAFFKGKDVCVVGGGDVAMEDSIYLSKLCNTVYLINRREKLRAAKVLQDKAKSIDNITFIPNSVVTEINGNENLENVVIKNTVENDITTLNVNGVFLAIGMMPENDIVKNVLALDDYGYIIADEDCITNVESIFVAGDIRTKPLRQVVTAVADGANAITSAEKYLN